MIRETKVSLLLGFGIRGTNITEVFQYPIVLKSFLGACRAYGKIEIMANGVKT